MRKPNAGQRRTDSIFVTAGRTIASDNRSGVWAYVGPGLGIGSIHLIVDDSSGWVTTFSAPLERTHLGSYRGASGFSWYGPKDAFLKEFKRVG